MIMFLLLSAIFYIILVQGDPCTAWDDGQNTTCRCNNSDCAMFGDDCDSSIDLSTYAVVPTGMELVCRSIFLNSSIQPLENEAFWMVSSCPESWSADTTIRVVIRDNCTSLSGSLPPITDMDTGIVYANEFCAICNRVEQFVAWQPNLICSTGLYELIDWYGVQVVLENFSLAIEANCKTCSYQVPSNDTVVAKPLPCNPACTNHDEHFVGNYSTTLVNDCIDGEINFVAAEVPTYASKIVTFYKNEACCVICSDFTYTLRKAITEIDAPIECDPGDQFLFPYDSRFLLPLQSLFKRSVLENFSDKLQDPVCVKLGFDRLNCVLNITSGSEVDSGSGPELPVLEISLTFCDRVYDSLSLDKLLARYGDEISESCGIGVSVASVLVDELPCDCILNITNESEVDSGSGLLVSESSLTLCDKIYVFHPGLDTFARDEELIQSCGIGLYFIATASVFLNELGCDYFFHVILQECICAAQEVGQPFTTSPSAWSKNEFKEYISKLVNDDRCYNVFAKYIIETAPVYPGIPFTVTFSSFNRGQLQSFVRYRNVTVALSCPDGYVAIGLSCRPTICSSLFKNEGEPCNFETSSENSLYGKCLSDDVLLNSSDYVELTNRTVLYKDKIYSIIRFESNRPVVCLDSSIRLAHCSTGLVVLNTSEFTSLNNETIDFNGKTYTVINFDAVGRAIVCPPNETSFILNINSTIYVYPVGYFILTYIGCSVSVIGCALLLLTYGLFKSLRTLPSLILMNLAAAILASNLLIITGGPVAQAYSSVGFCTTVAILLHFLFLAQFTWMSLMSFQMARTFYLSRKLKSVSKHYKVAFSAYFITGWGVPLLVTVVSIIVDFTTESLVSYGVLPDGKVGHCWINHADSAVVTFLVPLVLTMIINSILFIVVTVYLCLAVRSSTKVNKKQNIHLFRVNAAVFSVTGLTWVFGFIALIAGTSWAWYPFIIFNSTQGLIICIAFILTKSVLVLYRNSICCYTKKSVSNGVTPGIHNSRPKIVASNV